MTPKEQLLLEIEQAPDTVIEMVLNLLQSLKPLVQNQVSPWPVDHNSQDSEIDFSKNLQSLQSIQTEESDLPSFLKTLAEIHAEVPWSEWEKLPEDMAKNVDHYLYGAPKVEE
ncbi:MAG: hypothetical protein ACO3EZ_02550 [Prochlorotrichaceae cyanobacterium]